MQRLIRNPAIFLAAALQVLPLCRTVCTSPAAASTFAIILRWTVGATAALGAFDAVSGASGVWFTSPTNFSGTVGVAFTNNVTLTGNGGDAGAFFALTNKSGVVSPPLPNGSSTTSCMPAGLTFKCYDLNIGGSARPVYGAIYGTPTTPVTNLFIHVLCGFSGETPAQTNIFITILPFAGQSPVITNQPASLTNLAGSNPSFSVVAGGTAPLRYQWWRYETNLLANATNSSLTLNNVQTNNAGDYTVVITNSFGSKTSTVATLTVVFPPSITGLQPTHQTVLAGSNAAFNAVASGTAPLSYQWWNSTSAIGGQTNDTLTLNNAGTNDTGGYSVVVTNAYGSQTSSVVTLTVVVPPTISIQPQSMRINEGDPAAFSVSATGTGPLAYQWQRSNTNLADGGNLSGSTSNELSFSAATTNDAGIYSVVITNAYGSVTSDPALLTVGTPPEVTITGVVCNPDGSVTLSFLGGPGYAYLVQGTTNLTPPADWLILGAKVAGPDGTWQFTDQNTNQNTNHFRARFFRSAAP